MSKKTNQKYGNHKNYCFIKRTKKFQWTYWKAFKEFLKEIYFYYKCRGKRKSGGNGKGKGT